MSLPAAFRFRSDTRALLIDSITYAAAKGVPGVVGLLSVVVFIRLAGESHFGQFALAWTIVNVWVATTGGWYYQGVLRYSAHWSAGSPRIRDAAIRGLACSIGAFLIASLGHLLTGRGAWTALTIVCALALGAVMILQISLLARLQAHLASRRVLMAELIRTAGGFAAALGLVVVVKEQVAALLFGTAVGYGLSILYAYKSGSSPTTPPPGPRTNHSSTLRALWIYGWPLSLWFGGQFAMPLIDRTLMNAYWGDAVTGRYAALSELFTRCYSLFMFPITQAMMPRLIRLWDSHDTAAARTLIVRASWLLVALGSATVFITYQFRSALVKVAIETPSEADTALLVPLAASGFLWQFALVVHKPLELAGRTHLMLLTMILAVGVKLVATIWLMHSYGPLGAALASIAAGLVYCGVAAWICRPIFAQQRST